MPRRITTCRRLSATLAHARLSCCSSCGVLSRRRGAQAPRPTCVEAPNRSTQWLARLSWTRREPRLHDASFVQERSPTSSRCRASSRRPLPGRAEPGVRALPLVAGHAAVVRRGREHARDATPRSSGGSRTSIDVPAPVPAGDLGHRDAVRPPDRAIRPSSRRWPRWPGSRAAPSSSAASCSTR